ncbi:MAG: energy-coupling factor transporter transmembrane protein EcfT [Chloroflexi bacterium]|nr:energy-coupling factor transporter transmembrane protein EcfT [Chloroflexota bacterium]
MSAVYDLYQPGRSWLHRLDPRLKMVGACAGCVMVFLTRNVWLILLGVALMQGLLWSARLSRERIAWVWRVAAFPMVMIALLWVLVYRGEGKAWFTWWVITITPVNLAEAVAMALRIILLALIIFAWLFTTDQASLMLSMVALGVPFSWGLMVTMALRYLPTMASTFCMISEAQQARGLDLSRGGFVRRARAYIPITVAMLIHSLRTAQNLAYALESRALGARRRRTYLQRLHFRPLDWAALALIAGITLLFLWARFRYGFGAHPLGLWGLS